MNKRGIELLTTSTLLHKGSCISHTTNAIIVRQQECQSLRLFPLSTIQYKVYWRITIHSTFLVNEQGLQNTHINYPLERLHLEQQTHRMEMAGVKGTLLNPAVSLTLDSGNGCLLLTGIKHYNGHTQTRGEQALEEIRAGKRTKLAEH